MLSRLGSVVALTSMTALVLVGCSPPEPTETTPAATPRATQTPESLLAAAIATYEQYLNVEARLLSGDDVSATAFDGIATPEQAALAVADAEATVAQGYRTEGEFSTTAYELVRHEGARLDAVVCIDNTAVTVIDPSGNRMAATPADPALVTFEVAESPLVDYVTALPEGERFQCP